MSAHATINTLPLLLLLLRILGTRAVGSPFNQSFLWHIPYNNCTLQSVRCESLCVCELINSASSKDESRAQEGFRVPLLFFKGPVDKLLLMVIIIHHQPVF